MSLKKLLFVFILISSCFADYTANCQLSGRKELYKFSQPYFMGEGLSQFLYTKVNLKSQDFNREIEGNCVLVFKLTNDNKIKNLVVIDSTTNENFNRQVYDAIGDYPGSWQVAFLNKKPVDVNMRVTAKLSKITNTGSIGSGSIMGRRANAGRDLYNIIGDFEYLVDDVLANNFYNEGVAYSEAGEFNEAIKYFDIVIGFSANEVDALYSRGVCKFKTGDKLGACDDWKKIQASGKEDANKLIEKYCNQ